MLLARVTGHVIASQKEASLGGQKLYLVEPLNLKADAKPGLVGTGRCIVALDTVGCGPGQVVLLVQGSSARMTEVTRNLPADAVIIGIVDSALVNGKTLTPTAS